MNFRQLVEAVQAGAKPIVEFRKEIEELESYAEPGMWARVIDARASHHDMCRITFDFSEFDDRNRPLERANYYAKDGSNALLTARESGHYKPQDDQLFMLDGDIAPYFEVPSTDRFELYRSYAESGAAGGYVAWLEDRLLSLPMMRAASAQPTSTTTAPAIVPAHIELCAQFTATDSKGIQRQVTKVTVDREGYIPDVYVWLDCDCTVEAQLYDDEDFINAVMLRLSEQGYKGERFGRAELGMQSDRCVVLEPGREFNDWVATRGFVKLD